MAAKAATGTNPAAMSLNERMELVSRALRARFVSDGSGDWVYPEQTYDDSVVYRAGNKLWQLGYTINASDAVEWIGEPAEVDLTYVKAVAEGQMLGPLGENGRFLEAGGATKPTGKQWAVLVIQEGLSLNRNRYAWPVLEAALPLYQNAAIYRNHVSPRPKGVRPVEDKVGFLKDVRGAVVGGTQEAPTTGRQAIIATAVITNKAIREQMVEAWDAGNPNLFGFSHDADCEAVFLHSAPEDKKPCYDVRRIAKVASVDLVTEAAAGGRVVRLVASNTPAPTLEGDTRMFEQLLAAIKASGRTEFLQALEALGATPTEEQVVALHKRVLEAQPAPSPTPQPAPTPPATPPATPTPSTPAPSPTPRPASSAAAGGDTMVQVSEARLQALEAGVTVGTKAVARLTLQESLSQCSLPDLVKDEIRSRFTEAINAGQIPTDDAIAADIKKQVELFGKLAEKGIVLKQAPTTAQVTESRRQKIDQQLDDLLDPKKPIPSLKALYVDITGDVNFTGRMSEAKRLTEAMDSTTFDQVMANALNRRLVADYPTLQEADWRLITKTTRLSDFRQRAITRFGGYGNLPTVAERAPYPALTSPTDEQATYSPAKRGGTESLSLEMIRNDDAGAVRAIPQRMMAAARRTLDQFVWDFLATNAAVYDSVALAASGHTNIVTTAFSAANVASLRLKMMQQSELSSSARLGIIPSLLIVPADLEDAALTLVQSTLLPGGANNDVNLNRDRYQVVVPKYWTDTNNYWLTAKVADGYEMIEVGFLDGQETPEVFVQDLPTVGSLFNNDTITYKIRFIFGGAVVDYRPFGGGIVP